MYEPEVKYIRFHNTTNLPVIIESWVDGSNILQCATVKAGEKLLLHSSVGEWHMTTMFGIEQADQYRQWKDAGLQHYTYIGKFRSRPCAMGEYSWLENNKIFRCHYTQGDGDDYGLITFAN